MATLHFEIGKEYTLTKTFAESDVYWERYRMRWTLS